MKDIEAFANKLKHVDPFDYMSIYTLVDWEYRFDVSGVALERLHQVLSARFKDNHMRLKQDLTIQELCELLAEKLKGLKS